MSTSRLVKELKDNYTKIILNPESEYVKDLRKRVFVETQDASAIIEWFNIYYNIDTIEEECQMLEQIISNSDADSKEEIVSAILGSDNTSIPEQYLISYVNLLPEEERIKFYVDLIADTRIDNDDYKVGLAEKILDTIDYIPDLITRIDDEFDDNLLWGKLINLIVDRINVGDDLSNDIASFWSENSIYLDIYTKENNIKSGILYTYTEMEHYLPQVVVDTFLF